MTKTLNGLYAAYRAKTNSIQSSLNIVRQYTDNDNLYEPRAHATAIYSVLPANNQLKLEAKNILDRHPTLFAYITSLEIFDSPSTEGHNFTLVGVLACPQLDSIHKELLALGLTHPYDPYRPHISLGYELSEKIISQLLHSCVTITVGKVIELYQPYVEPLNEN